jgi:hypothetical protein
MKFQIQREPWVIGAILIPPTTIDTSASDDWSRLAKGRVPPPNAYALDQETYDLLRTVYPTHQIHAGPGVLKRAPSPHEQRHATMQLTLDKLTVEISEAQAKLDAMNNQLKAAQCELGEVEQATAQAVRARDAVQAQLRKLEKLFGSGEGKGARNGV